MAKPDWHGALENSLRAAVNRGGSDTYLTANIHSTRQVVQGLGPDSTTPDTGAGLRIVFNISCKHVPVFCQSTGTAYKNCYDLNTVGTKRKGVDEAVEAAAQLCQVTLEPKDMYFGAVEATGSGIRFYGDMCFVLKARPAFVSNPVGRAPMPMPARASAPPSETDAPLLVLSRNSYDVIREPVAAAVQLAAAGGLIAPARADQVLSWMGTWQEDLPDLIATKILEHLPHSERRWTTGQIAQAVLNDEDYIEVLYPHSFAPSHLLEVRLSAAEVAAENDIAAREAAGESPSQEELEWRLQRTEARRALARAAVPVRVVVTSGRIKGP